MGQHTHQTSTESVPRTNFDGAPWCASSLSASNTRFLPSSSISNLSRFAARASCRVGIRRQSRCLGKHPDFLVYLHVFMLFIYIYTYIHTYYHDISYHVIYVLYMILQDIVIYHYYINIKLYYIISYCIILYCMILPLLYHIILYIIYHISYLI